MVKKFRRAAAGLEEQLPSDLRPAPVLKKTCDYLFNEVIGNAAKLAQVHHFVWDRTRAIRNDFSIQQLTRPDELRIAVDCYERIARFHILSLHQLALPEKPYSKYDWQQEREQLDRTLLSLMQYYDDSRGRIDLPNEAEFRAYCVIFQLQDPTPDLEDRVQSWPRAIVQDQRVEKAIEMYMAACNIMDAQGPLKPRANHLIARQDWQRFWILVSSVGVSYLMACVAEIYFNLVRRMVLNALFRTSRANTTLNTTEWTMDVLCEMLAFDDGDDVYTFCERFGFTFKENAEGVHYLDLTSVRGRTLPEPTAGMPNQSKTSIVEEKRFGRTLPAVIYGLSVGVAQAKGMVNEEVTDEGMDIEDAEENEMIMSGGDEVGDDDHSLFIPESKKPSMTQITSDPPSDNQNVSPTKEAPSTSSSFGLKFTFGKPSASGDTPSFSSPTQHQATSGTQSTDEKSAGTKFDFLGLASAKNAQPTTDAPVFEPNAIKNPWSTQTPKSETTASTNFSFGTPSAKQSSIFAKPTAPLGQDHQAPAFQYPGASTSKSEATSSSLFAPKTEEQGPSQKPQTESLLIFTATGAPAQTTLSPSSQQPSHQPETKASQPHFTAPTPTAASTSPPNLPIAQSGLGSAPKRSSVGHENKPKKPSPLANSFTASDDSSAVETETAEPLTANSPVKELFPRKRSQSTPAPAETKTSVKPQNATDEFRAIITRLAGELVDDEPSGYLNQFIEFTISQTITEVQEQLAIERLNDEAADWRKFTLLQKFGKRWKDVFWQRRTLKSGRERRQRRQQRLAERDSGVDGGSLFDTESVQSSRAGSVTESRFHNSQNRQEMVESMFRQTFKDRQSAPATSGEHQARPGSKRPLSSHGTEASMAFRESGHKRLKSTSHVDERGRITKPAATSHPNADILKRSSFLGFSLASDGLNSKNTTSSNYFRLKAIGLNKPEFSSNPRGNKRRLSDSLQASSHTSPPGIRSASQLRCTPGPEEKTLMPPPSSVPPRAQKTHDDDEALFARLRAAREGLKESTSFYQSEAAKPDDHQQSMNSSQSSTESPSMIKARAEARLRASQAASESDTASLRAVPAYRQRESKFVPRERYGEAIQRSTEFRASRSREPSRPTSPVRQTPAEPVKVNAPSYERRDSNHHTPSEIETPTFTFGGPTGLSHAPEVQHLASSLAGAANSFASTASQAPLSFANHNTEISSQNPFLQAPVTSGFAQYSSQPTFGLANEQPPPASFVDHTIQPSQIDESLVNSFRASKIFGHNTFQPIPPASPTPPQPDSYLASQAISLLSDDDDDDDATALDASRQQSYSVTENDDATEELLDNGYGSYESYGQYAHTNPYMALAHDQDAEEESQSFQSQVDDEEIFDEDPEERQNGYADDEEEDEDEELDEDESEDAEEDEEGYGYDEDEEEDAGELGQSKQWQHGRFIDPRYAPPEPNAELQDFGNTAEEAIELSD